MAFSVKQKMELTRNKKNKKKTKKLTFAEVHTYIKKILLNVKGVYL